MSADDILKLRMDLAWTQEELADFLHVTTRIIKYWEGGGRIPKETQKQLTLIKS